ncbi:MAG: glycoside hydrolase family 13 protein [Candidatus Competibacteraceae bacterium]|nr:glycoside hydrolase family 13 protein [Candidatus Competibacteraceae bacterium]
MNVHTPNWARHAVFYQIFPDRFAPSPRTRHLPGLTFRPWGSPPEEQGFHGGDLRGVVDRLDYLEELGINALYLCPIFASAANHRYHPYDYFKVDPLLGGDQALGELLVAAHGRGMKVVLDGVFNHASRGFWPFHHILENGGDSPYLDWFIIHDWPLRAYHSDHVNPCNYEAWVGLPMLPKLNTANPGVREMILECTRHWLAFGIDGWRLDVPNEIDDPEFWRDFRRVAKEVNPQAYLCGEIWVDAREWLQGDRFDGVMNYLFTWPVLSFFGRRTLNTAYPEQHPHIGLKALQAPAFAKAMEQTLQLYPRAVTEVQMNLIGSHDTARALWMVGGDRSALELAVLMQMTFPGAPCIYYGDEIGLTGGHDPYCRGAFPWERSEEWDRQLLEHYRRAIALRHAHPVLRTGDFATLHAQDDLYAFARQLEGTKAVVAFNAARETAEVELPVSAGHLEEVWPGDGQAPSVNGGKIKLTLPARQGRVLVGH